MTIVQERVQTEYFKDELTHQTHPEDRLLNTSQLRSAEAIRRFATNYRYPNMGRQELIAKAIANKHALEYETRQSTEAKATAKIAKAAAKAKKAEQKKLREEKKVSQTQAAERGEGGSMEKALTDDAPHTSKRSHPQDKELEQDNGPSKRTKQ